MVTDTRYRLLELPTLHVVCRFGGGFGGGWRCAWVLRSQPDLGSGLKRSSWSAIRFWRRRGGRVVAEA